MQTMQAASLLASNPNPTDEEIVESMNGNLCRCMTYNRIKKAIKRASTEMMSDTAGEHHREEEVA